MRYPSNYDIDLIDEEKRGAVSEADLLELAAMSRANLGFLVTQIIAVQFAIIAGIHLFLHRAGLFLKVAIFVLYTAGYVGLLSLYYWEQAAYVAVREAIRVLPDGTPAAAAVIEWIEGPGRNLSAFVKGLFAVNWFVIAFFLFAPVFRHRD